jgi:ParB family chromosome partitioning protein
MKRKTLGQITFSGQIESQYLALTQIQLPAYQPRQYFAPESLQELAQALKKQGVLEPLLVRRQPNSNVYELIAGGRRYRAAEIAQLTEVPVRILDISENEAREISIAENLQREDLNPVEETEAILQLLSVRLAISVEEVRSLLYRRQNELKGKTTDNVVGKSEKEIIQGTFEGLMSLESFMTHRLRLLNLPPEILAALKQGQIAYTKAQAIAKVTEEKARKKLLNEAIESSLSLSQIRERVAALAPTQAEKEDLRSQFDATYKQLRKVKSLWQDPKKKRKLKSLLAQLEKLMENSEQ